MTGLSDGVPMPAQQCYDPGSLGQDHLKRGFRQLAQGAVPDLPGCNSAGNILFEAVSNAEEAAALWLDVALDEGEAIPVPSDPATLVAPPGWIIGLISVDPDALDDTIERINITIARRALSRLDAQARAARQSRRRISPL